jgi:hypothetical protein
MTKPLLVIAACYIALIGLALLIVPAQFGVGAVPTNPSPELLALLRLLGGPLLGIAVLNWMSRKIEPSVIRNTVILANIVGFGIITANDIVGVVSGSARDLANIFLIVHLAFTIAFIVVWVRARGDSAARTGRVDVPGISAESTARQEPKRDGGRS